jgi:hydrogenase expression/formation protein HypE
VDSSQNNNNITSCSLPITKYDTIQLSHGSGGLLTNDLVTRLFIAVFDNPPLNKQNDQAIIEVGGKKLAFSTDSYVVDPIFFPGGDIGKLAVNGTINDLCMSGAKPLCLSAGFIIEEGLPVTDLERVVASMKRAAEEARVQIVTGDTKVVNKGHGDKLFINTAGIGIVEHDYEISSDRLRPGDVIMISGTVGDHAVAILCTREGLSFESPIESDTASLNTLVETIIKVAGGSVHAMRDPTRGGVTAALNDFARRSQVGMQIFEDKIPVNPSVAGVCEVLGLDPLFAANEGKLIAVVDAGVAEATLNAMRAHPLGQRANIIGVVTDDRPGTVLLKTAIGGWRFMNVPVGEQLPRIC